MTLSCVRALGGEGGVCSGAMQSIYNRIADSFRLKPAAIPGGWYNASDHRAHSPTGKAMPHADRPRFETLAIVGVGLIGGSIGLAARRFGAARHIIGVGRRQASLDEALAVGAIDEACLAPEDAGPRANLMVFCTPVDQIAHQVLAVAPRCAPGTLLTDGGSTKAGIVRSVEGKLPDGVAFVGSHPLAGSEKRGPRFADALLFKDRVTVLTPTARSDPDAVEKIAGFWRALGSRVKVMTPEDHDRALALTSHLPHLLATALSGILPGELRELAAGGFRDTTRIAAGDPSVWTGIFLQNRGAVLEALDKLQARLSILQQLIQAGDRAALDELLAQANTNRDALGS
jgi:prephenate dehydrogenase